MVDECCGGRKVEEGRVALTDTLLRNCVSLRVSLCNLPPSIPRMPSRPIRCRVSRQRRLGGHQPRQAETSWRFRRWKGVQGGPCHIPSESKLARGSSLRCSRLHKSGSPAYRIIEIDLSRWTGSSAVPAENELHGAPCSCHRSFPVANSLTLRTPSSRHGRSSRVVDVV